MRAGRVPLALAVLLCALASSPAHAQEPDAPSEETQDTAAPDGGAADAGAPQPADTPSDPLGELPGRRLNLAVLGNPPFHLSRGGEPSGLSVDVWHALAARLEVDYALTVVPNAGVAIDGVADGTYDGAIGPISITSERAQRVDFTQPYHDATLAILTLPGSSGAWERIEPFLTKAFFGALALLLLVLTLVGALMWVVERKANDGFPKAPLAGVGVGIWLALVTMTTVGYGDKAPITPAGRLLTGVWMVLSMLTVSSLTAGIATALTLSQLDRAAIETAGELAGRPVATLEGTTAAALARRNDANIIAVDDLQEGIDRLVDERVDAVVYDRPVLQYHLRQNEDLGLALSAHEYDPQGYGFAFPLGSSLAHQVNVELLALEESGQLEAIKDEWL
ncbi:MAG: transporter substrate-binding domain-containing protein [Sandaracinaceae bacterium]